MSQDVFGLSKAKTGRPAPFLLPKKLLRLVVGGWTGGTGSELTGRLAGNSTFEAAVEEGFQPYQGEAPLQFGQSKTYTVKELVPEGYEASYVTAGGHTIITNIRTKQPDTAEIVPPKTGDSFGLYTVIALLFLSLGALLTLAASRKSRS